MQISTETMNVLKNFTQINPSILIQKGNVLRTIDFEKTITSSASIVEEFPKDFAIYDLPTFLSVIQMFDGASIDFGDEDTNLCTINYPTVGQKIRYLYASPEAVEQVKKDIVMPQTEINFLLSKANLVAIKKAATTMDLPHVVVTPDGDGAVILTATSVDNPSSNTFEIRIEAEVTIEDFFVVFDFQKFNNLLENDYNVGISTKEISHFFNDKIQYWVALNANSNFEG
jgi:hypothetical protein